MYVQLPSSSGFRGPAWGGAVKQGALFLVFGQMRLQTPGRSMSCQSHKLSRRRWLVARGHERYMASAELPAANCTPTGRNTKAAPRPGLTSEHFDHGTCCRMPNFLTSQIRASLHADLHTWPESQFSRHLQVQCMLQFEGCG